MRRHFSPAMVVALIALFIASAGTATAAGAKLITGAQIKNGSIGLLDLSASAKRALKGNRGPQGPAGAPGVQGAPGAQGVPGPVGGFDPNKVMYVKGAAVAVAPEQFGSATAKCPGTRAISGGFIVQSEGDVTEVNGSHPNDDGMSWTVVVYNWDIASATTVTPFVICVTA